MILAIILSVILGLLLIPIIVAYIIAIKDGDLKNLNDEVMNKRYGIKRRDK